MQIIGVSLSERLKREKGKKVTTMKTIQPTSKEADSRPEKAVTCNPTTNPNPPTVNLTDFNVDAIAILMDNIIEKYSTVRFLHITEKHTE